ncbi:MAG: hypothetical protein V5A59_07020 [Bacteroidales bacterium]
MKITRCSAVFDPRVNFPEWGGKFFRYRGWLGSKFTLAIFNDLPHPRPCASRACPDYSSGG